MNKIFYVCALILCAIWALCYFVWHVGGLVHILPVIAVISIALSIAEAKQLSQ